MIVKTMWPLVPGCSDITSGAELQSQFWREPSVGQQQAVAWPDIRHNTAAGALSTAGLGTTGQ